MAWINEVENPSIALVEKIYWAKSGKGLIIQGNKYSCFVWKDSKLAMFLMEALTTWIETGNTKKPIEIHPDNSCKEGFKLLPKTKGIKTPDHEWWLSGDMFVYGLPSIKEQEEVNPFL
jgi:hypothetical protein